MFNRSDAENIYNDWISKDIKNACTADGLEDGKFHKVIMADDGFKPMVDELLTMETEAIKKEHKQHVVEQIWKLVDKVERRLGEAPAWELMQRIWREDDLCTLLEAYETNFGALYEQGSDVAVQAKINRAHIGYRHLMKVEFKESKKLVTLGRVLGKGGMGGAVYLGKDVAGNEYAVKRFPGSYEASKYHGATTGNKVIYRQQEILQKFKEADATTTCIDYTIKGADQYLLLEMGKPCDYTKLKLADIINTYQDLDRLENYALQLKTHVTEDVLMLHLDIHGENLMYFDDKLRLIDFGMFWMFNMDPKLTEKVIACDLDELIDSKKINYWWRYAIEEVKDYANTQSGKWKTYLETWKDYGSNADKVSGLSIGKIGPQQYGNVVLTTVLTKEILAAQAKKHNYDFYPKAAPMIVNTTAYKLAKDAIPQFKEKKDDKLLLVENLLGWMDEMMVKMYKGETVTAQTALVYFTGGSVDSPIHRTRSATTFF